MTPARLAPSLPATALAGRDLHPQDIAGFAQRTLIYIDREGSCLRLRKDGLKNVSTLGEHYISNLYLKFFMKLPDIRDTANGQVY